MTKVTSFPAYSGRENHATNNTMVMLRHVYRESPQLLRDLFRRLFESDSLSLEPSFEQQVRMAHSVPDGAIRQPAFELFIEVKAGAPLTAGQLRQHIRSIAAMDARARQVLLLTLTPEAPEPQITAQVSQAAREEGITFAAVTFGDLADALAGACVRAPALDEIVSDYQAFLREAGLLPIRDQIVVFPVGTSGDDNVRLGMYYEPLSRPTKLGCRYIALYTRKTITHVADMGETYVAEGVGRVLRVTREADESPAASEAKARIERIIVETSYYDLRRQATRFYLVSDFHPTSFTKASPHGILGARYLRAGDYGVSGTPPAAEVARLLDGKHFT